MQVYPAYTIDRIEIELSSRVMAEMMECWAEEECSIRLLSRIDNMVAHKFGFKKVSSKPLHGDALRNRLVQEGLL